MEEYVEGSPFILFVNSFIRIISKAKVLYYDKNSQLVQVELEDSSEQIDLSVVLAETQDNLETIDRTYS